MEGDIKFDEPEYAYSASSRKGPSGLSGLVIRFGLAKDEPGAQKALLVILGVCILATIAILWFSSGSVATSAGPNP